jgi:hypothetical protein
MNRSLNNFIVIGDEKNVVEGSFLE